MFCFHSSTPCSTKNFRNPLDSNCPARNTFIFFNFRSCSKFVSITTASIKFRNLNFSNCNVPVSITIGASTSTCFYRIFLRLQIYVSIHPWFAPFVSGLCHHSTDFLGNFGKQKNQCGSRCTSSVYYPRSTSHLTFHLRNAYCILRLPFLNNSYLDSSIPCGSMLQLYFSMAIAASKIKETRPTTNFLCVTPPKMKFPVE